MSINEVGRKNVFHEMLDPMLEVSQSLFNSLLCCFLVDLYGGAKTKADYDVRKARYIPS